MSIAEKLTTIAENVPNVYKAGQDSQQSTIDNLQNQLDIANNLNSTLQKSWQAYHDEINEIRNEIRNLNVDVSGDIEPLSDAIPEVYEAGKKSQYDEFWDNFQQNGNRISYTYSFSQGWDDNNYNPKYNFILDGANSGNGMFQYSKITNIKRTVIVSNKCSLMYAFSNANIVTIPLLVVDNTVKYANSFANATNLQSITFEGEISANINFVKSTLLTKASIENIVNTLSAAESGKTLSLSKTAVNKAFETAEGLADGSSSAEWVALIGPKSNQYDGNWTITLL